MRRPALLVALVAVTAASAAAAAGTRWLRPAPGPASDPVLAGPAPQEDPPYDGRFVFVRVRYGGDSRGSLRGFGGWGRRGSREAPWEHDHPDAEQNFAKILNATTYVDNYLEGFAGRILELDDPELFRYPLAYIVEVGSWSPSDAEVEALRSYLLKGGFLIVDDFRGERALRNFMYHMERVLPGAPIHEVPDDHEIFDSFFHIEEPQALTPPYGGQPPFYLGYYEDDDPSKRLMVIVNYNNDHMEYWEFSDRGYYPIDLSNEAYKFGINYVIYAMTH